MASDWKKELHKYENGRSFGKDLKDSFRVACSAAALIASFIPDSASIKKKSRKMVFVMVPKVMAGMWAIPESIKIIRDCQQTSWQS